MNAERLSACLETLGWGEVELSFQTDIAISTVRKWAFGRDPIPPAIAAWLEDLAAYHEAHPVPARREVVR